MNLLQKTKFLSEHPRARFIHAFCPDCFDAVLGIPSRDGTVSYRCLDCDKRVHPAAMLEDPWKGSVTYLDMVKAMSFDPVRKETWREEEAGITTLDEALDELTGKYPFLAEVTPCLGEGI